MKTKLLLALIFLQVAASAQTLRFLSYFSPTNEIVSPTNWVAHAVTIRNFTNETAMTIGLAGVRITHDSDGALTFTGLGNGSDEDLTLNFDDTANTISVSSSTGVTDFDFGTIDVNTDTLDLTGTGTINGLDAIDTTTEDTLEAALELQSLQGAVTDGQVPNTITIDLSTLASTVTVVDGTDATSFPAIFDSVTGSLAVKTDAALTYNASNGTLGATTLSGAGGGLTLDASGFNGNLATTDNTLQEVAQKVDDLNLGAGSQTPWTSNINADENSLTNITSIVGTGSGATVINNATSGVFIIGTHFVTNGWVLNIDNSDLTLTHTANVLTLVGGDLVVPTEAYDATGWNGDNSVPTKDAVRDKIETMAGGAPSGADYLVGTADGTLSAEIVVGTSPGGELGGTWASPTLDDSVTVATWTMTGTRGLTVNNGATSAGAIGFSEDSDNGANIVTLIGPASTADVTLTLPAATDTLVGKATTDVFTNKDYDASATGNVLRQTKQLILQRPDYGDGAGAVPQTNTFTASGLMHYTFSGNAETNANWVVYEFDCPSDLDTTVAMTARFGFLSGGTDADDYVFHLTYDQVAAGTAYPTGTGVDLLPIVMTVTPTTPANGDLQYSSAVTLTGWAAALTPGRAMQVRVARLQNSQDDGARDVQLVISYGSTL